MPDESELGVDGSGPERTPSSRDPQVIEYIKDVIYENPEHAEVLNSINSRMTGGAVTSLDSLLEHIDRRTPYGDIFYKFFSGVYWGRQAKS